MKNYSWYLEKLSLVSTALILLAAILVALFVIQPAAIDTHEGVNHEKIVFIWGFNITMNILIAYALVILSLVKKEIGWIVTTWILMIIVFFMALIYIDAGSAYIGHGPDMQRAAIFLFICAGLEIVALLLLISTLLFRKKIIAKKS